MYTRWGQHTSNLDLRLHSHNTHRMPLSYYMDVVNLYMCTWNVCFQHPLYIMDNLNTCCSDIPHRTSTDLAFSKLQVGGKQTIVRKATNLIPVSEYPRLRPWMQPTVAEEQIEVQGFVPVMCLVPGRDNTCNN